MRGYWEKRASGDPRTFTLNVLTPRWSRRFRLPTGPKAATHFPDTVYAPSAVVLLRYSQPCRVDPRPAPCLPSALLPLLRAATAGKSLQRTRRRIKLSYRRLCERGMILAQVVTYRIQIIDFGKKAQRPKVRCAAVGNCAAVVQARTQFDMPIVSASGRSVNPKSFV